LRLLQEAKERERALWEREIDAALSHVKVRQSLLESELLLMAHRNYSAGLLLRAAWCLWRLVLHEIANAHSCTYLQAQEEHQRNETARSSEKMKQIQEAQATELQQASVL
jgi:hypothetical protein